MTASPIATQETVNALDIAIAAAHVFIRDVPDGWFLYEETGAGDVLLSRHQTEFAALAARDLWIADRALSSAERRNEELVNAAERHRDMLKQLLDEANARHFDATMRADAAEATIASLTGTVGEMREALYQDPPTYTWMGHTHVIDAPETSDFEVAGTVRMLTREQLDHEYVCTLARGRIVHLSERLTAARKVMARALEPSPPGISTTGGDGGPSITQAHSEEAR